MLATVIEKTRVILNLIQDLSGQAVKLIVQRYRQRDPGRVLRIECRTLS